MIAIKFSFQSKRKIEPNYILIAQKYTMASHPKGADVWPVKWL
jgi:hypothetical protein